MSIELVRQLPYDHPYRWDGSLFGGPVLWQPSALSDLEYWFDAEDLSTITLNGANVSQWSDKSGKDRHATQATAADQPGFNTTGWSANKPAVYFDGNNAGVWPRLIMPNSAGVTPTIVAVVRPTTTIGTGLPGTSNAQIISTGGFTSGWGVSANAKPEVKWGAISGAANTTIATDMPAILTLDYLANSYFYNGLSDGVYNPTTGNSTAGLGGRAATLAFKGFMAEIVGSSQSTDAATRQKLEGYLAWKWGLEANLPAGHPYKTIPPTR